MTQAFTIAAPESSTQTVPKAPPEEDRALPSVQPSSRLRELLEDRFGFFPYVEPNADVVASLKSFARLAGLTVTILGALVFLGWLSHLGVLKSVSTSMATMKVNTALDFVLLGAALGVLSTERANQPMRVAARGCAFVGALLGLATLAEYVNGWNLGIDQAVIKDTLSGAGTSFAGRMAPATAANFVLLGIALLLLDIRRGYPAAQCLALVAALISLTALVGYVYGVPSLYRVGSSSGMALHASVGFLTLSSGVLLTRQDRGLLAIITSDAVGGMMARRLLPAAVIVPLLLGFLAVSGKNAGIHGSEFGIYVVVMSSIVFFAILIWWNSGSLYRLDTERVRAEDALKKGQAQLAEAQRIAHVGSAEWDISGDAVAWSDEFYRILGMEPQAVPASDAAFLERIHADDRDSVRQIIDNATKSTAPCSLDYRVIYPNGTPRLIHGESRVVCDESGLPVRVTVTAQDVTDRKRTEYALRKSEERTRSIIDSANDAFIAIDQGGRITDWNPQAEAIFGWPRDLATGQTMADTILPERLREEHRESLHRFLTTGEGPVLNTLVEILALHRDGHEFPVELTMSVVGSGRSYMFSAFLRDITERKQAEEKLTQHTQDLARINAELEDFTHSVSHDLKEPLRGIEAFAGFLAEDYGDKLDEQGQRYVNVLRDSAVRMKDLIDDLLQLSRIGRTAIEYVDVPVRAMVEDVGLDLDFALKEKNVDLRIDDSLPTIACDKVRMREVFKNLISNAIKYNDKPHPVVEISCLRENGAYTFSIRDNGIGIEEQYHDKIFRIFQRLHRREEYEGTGVGLTICKKIVEAHGGTIRIESALGEGTTFLFTIPRTPVGSALGKEKVA